MKKLLNKFLDLLSPDDIKCIVCDAELSQDSRYGMCKSCLDKLPKINKACNKCGREIFDDGKYCFDCKEDGFAFDKVYSCLNYEDYVTKLVYNLKYGGGKYLAKYMARVIADKIKEEKISFDILTYVPLNEKRESERGFNQAKLIADEAAKELSCASQNLLTRIRNTPYQASLNREERLTNLKDAFEIVDKKLIKGKTILIIDDIFTTGTTLNECSKILKKAGAKCVIGITFAHAKKKFV